jgi:clan AA aspartic protease
MFQTMLSERFISWTPSSSEHRATLGFAMALTHVNGKVNRAGRRQRPVAVRFLVDTGAVYTVLPKNVWRTLGLTGDRVAEFTLADGTTIRRDVSECRVQVEGQTATSPVVLGGPDDAPLLGAVTLETLGLMVNPLTRELLPMRLMLAGATGRSWAPALLPS